MTNPTPQDREMADRLLGGELAMANILLRDQLTQAITTARLQGRREGLEEAASELIEALMAANRYLINIGHDGSITGKLIRTALAKWDKP